MRPTCGGRGAVGVSRSSSERASREKTGGLRDTSHARRVLSRDLDGKLVAEKVAVEVDAREARHADEARALDFAREAVSVELEVVEHGQLLVRLGDGAPQLVARELRRQR